MEYDDFRDAVLELAGDGVRITKGSVALRLKVDPKSAGAMLDRMTRDGLLELDVDEKSGDIFYTRTRDKRATSESSGERALASLGKAVAGSELAAKVGTAMVMEKLGGGGPLAPEKRRRVGVGVLLGGLLPGIGLVYTAPWPVAIAASVVVIVGYKIITFIPFLSAFLLVPFLVVCALGSAVLGGLYTWQYNQTGKRTPLRDEPTSPREILARLGKKREKE